MNAPRADGIGVRRPLAREVRREEEALRPRAATPRPRRRGRRTTSRARGGRGATAASPRRRASRPSRATGPGTAWQKACTRACGSAAKAGSAAKTTPEVPSTIESGPGRSIPTPTAAAAQSPAPAATGIPCRQLVTRARDAADAPGDSSTGGSQAAGSSSASSTSSDQRRRATSSRSVPDASATSVAHSPVSRSRT